jgi:hypothetical protein
MTRTEQRVRDRRRVRGYRNIASLVAYHPGTGLWIHGDRPGVRTTRDASAADSGQTLDGISCLRGRDPTSRAHGRYRQRA